MSRNKNGQFASGPRPERKNGKMIFCHFCNKEFYVAKNREGKAKYCSKKCMYEGLKTPVKNCIACGKKFWRRNMRSSQNYCSRECAANGRSTRETMTCDYCGEKTHKCKSNIKNYKKHFCSIECANKHQGRNKINFTCKTCGNEFKWSKSRIKDHNPKYCSIKCRDDDPDYKGHINGNISQQKKKGLNKLELEGRRTLNELNIKFDEQVLMFNKFLVDVLLKEKHIVIQWDGDYWHGHPLQKPYDKRQIKRKKLDKSQDSYIKKCGYKVLRFWESDVKNNKEKVYADIKRAIQQTS